MKFIYCIAFACLFFLVGTGLQYLFYGMFSLSTIDMSKYTLINWVLQATWWTMLVAFGILAGDNAHESTY